MLFHLSLSSLLNPWEEEEGEGEEQTSCCQATGLIPQNLRGHAPYVALGILQRKLILNCMQQNVTNLCKRADVRSKCHFVLALTVLLLNFVLHTVESRVFFRLKIFLCCYCAWIFEFFFCLSL